MTEQKRPVLTLKRKTEGETPVRSRKTIINVTTPPKWKVKKQKLAEKAAREAALIAEKREAARELSVYGKIRPLAEAVGLLKPWWPELFEGDMPRLLQCGIREELLAEVEEKHLPLSRKQLRRALKTIVRSPEYLTAMNAGAARYSKTGDVAGVVTAEDEASARERLKKRLRQQRRRAELQAILDRKY